MGQSRASQEAANSFYSRLRDVCPSASSSLLSVSCAPPPLSPPWDVHAVLSEAGLPSARAAAVRREPTLDAVAAALVLAGPDGLPPDDNPVAAAGASDGAAKLLEWLPNEVCTSQIREISLEG